MRADLGGGAAFGGKRIVGLSRAVVLAPDGAASAAFFSGDEAESIEQTLHQLSAIPQLRFEDMLGLGAGRVTRLNGWCFEVLDEDPLFIYHVSRDLDERSFLNAGATRRPKASWFDVLHQGDAVERARPLHQMVAARLEDPRWSPACSGLVWMALKWAGALGPCGGLAGRVEACERNVDCQTPSYQTGRDRATERIVNRLATLGWSVGDTQQRLFTWREASLILDGTDEDVCDRECASMMIVAGLYPLGAPVRPILATIVGGPGGGRLLIRLDEQPKSGSGDFTKQDTPAVDEWLCERCRPPMAHMISLTAKLKPIIRGA
jgi:hypothetical protein